MTEEEQKAEAQETSKMIQELIDRSIEGTTLEGISDYKVGVEYEDNKTKMFVNVSSESVIDCSAMMGLTCEMVAALLADFLASNAQT